MNRKWLTTNVKKWYKPVLGTALVLVLVFLLFGWRIGQLPPNFSLAENSAVVASSSVRNIVNNPLNVPHKIIQYGSQKLFGVSTTSMRLVSVVFGLLALLCFYLICRWWFKSSVALMALALFALNPWVVINARSADTTIMLLSTLVVITAYLWLQSTNKHHNLALITLAVTGVLSLYIPGVVWVTLIGALVVQKPILEAYRQSAKVVQYSLPVIGALLVTPLVYAVIYEPALLQKLLLIPDDFFGVVESLKAVAWTGLGVVWRTRDNLPTTLGTLPMLDALAVVLFAIGSFWLFSEYRRRRTYWLFGSLAVSIVIIGLNHNALLLVLILPAVFIIVAAGLNFLYREWFRVFPRNPLAKWVGICVISTAILVSGIYSVRYGLIAWPRSPETKAHYVLQ